MTANAMMIFVGRILMLASLSCISLSSGAQEYPSKPIRMIFPYAPGANDLLARVLGEKMTKQWGQPVIVETRPGANTIIGTDAVARSAPDGYTLLVTTDVLLLNPLVQKVSYDPIKGFEPIAVLGLSTQMVVSSLPATNLKDLIALIKAKPGSLNFGFADTTQEINLDYLKRAANIDFVQVPYQGGAPMSVALLGGQVDMVFVGPGSVLDPQIKSGKFRAIAAITGSGKRDAAMPDVPTFSEAGLPEFKPLMRWYAIFAPAGTPKEIVRKLNAAVTSALKDPDVASIYRSRGFSTPTSRNSPEDTAAFVKSELTSREQAVKDFPAVRR